MAIKPTIRRYRLGGVNRAADTDAENAGSLRCENLLPCATGGLRGRAGYKVNAQIGANYATGGVMGMTEAHIPDRQYDEFIIGRQDELLIACITGSNNVEGGLYRAQRYVVTITNANVTDDYYVNFVVISGTWRCRVLDDDLAELAIINLGTPKNNANSFAELATALNAAVSDLTITYPSGFQTSRSASYVTPVQVRVPAGSSVNFDCITGAASPFVSEGPTTSLGVLDHCCRLSEFGPSRLFHGIQFQNRVWFRDIWRLRKYDGKNAWFAGVQAPAIPTLTPSATGGSIADGDYRYLLTYSVIDAQGYEVESDGTESGIATVSGGGGSGSISLSNMNTRDGWIPTDAGMAAIVTNGWGAVCSSTMGSPGTAVTCATYLRLDAGDPVYLYDRATSAYMTRYVVSVVSTTVTLDANVQLNSGDAMSPVKVNIYRSKVGPSTLFYLVTSRPVSIAAATGTYPDSTSDANLGVAYQLPLVEHTPPPAQDNDIDPEAEDESGSFPLELYRNSLVMGGLWGDRGACAFSDVDFPEYWPEENRFRPGEGTEEITGLKAIRDFLLVFTETNTYQVTGDLTTGEFRAVPLGVGIGCSSHDSIANCNGAAYWCSAAGVYRTDGGAPEKISGAIEDIFASTLTLDENNGTRRRLDRAVGCYMSDRNQYWLFIPTCTPNPDSTYIWAVDGISSWNAGDGTGTVCLVFDIGRSEWFFLTQVDFSLGLRVYEGEQMGLSVGEPTTLGATKVIQLTQRIQRPDEYASVDDSLYGGASNSAVFPIYSRYVSRFDSLGNPGVLKKPIRMRIESLNTREPAAWTFDARGYRDYANVDATSTYYTLKEDIALSASQTAHKWRLLPKRVLSFAFELLSSGTVYERATVTGVEVLFAESYRDAFKEPNG